MAHHVHSGKHAGETTHGAVIHWAAAYDFLFGRMIRRTHPAIVALADARPGDRVLDVGCGPGSLTLAFKAAVGPTGTVHGIDAAPEMIEVARKNAAKARAEATFRVGVAEALPFADGAFDVVVSQLAMHHFPADLRETVFREMHRVLKPEGRCLIVDFEPPRSGPGRLLGRLLLAPMMMNVNVENYRPLMERGGFEEIETGRTRHRLLSFIRGRAAPLET